MLRDLIALPRHFRDRVRSPEHVPHPGVIVIDECPWKRVLEYWPAPFPSLADAAIVAVAATKRYDAIATFDQKLSKRSRDLGVTAYW